MKLKYDTETDETVIRFTATELGDILFALDVTATEATTEKNRECAMFMRKKIVTYLAAEVLTDYNGKPPVADPLY